MIAGARSLALVGVVLLALASGCAGAAATSGVGRVDEAQRMRAGLGGRDAQTLAPQAFAAADQELRLAKEAQASGDTTGAELHADRALAMYNQAIALARLARATQDEATAGEALARASGEAQKYAAQRKAVDREADDLEKKLRVVREAQLPPASGPADPERERARVVAAQALVTQARLLCSAARLVSQQAPGLADAEAAVTGLEKQIDASKTPVTIDPAARARAACLTSLTKARRALAPGPDADQADTLLGELSQAAGQGAVDAAGTTAKHADLAPARDERGVVVTLRSAFKADKLSPEAETSVKDLGRVAAAHPTFAVQVVIHDAQAPSAAEVAGNRKRGESIVQALVAGGLAAAKIKVEQAGNRAPVVDPKDARHRDRNGRVEIVFVSSGT
jgi:outer membrane protein OmpA-like peptidoglycan-associated protein